MATKKDQQNEQRPGIVEPQVDSGPRTDVEVEAPKGDLTLKVNPEIDTLSVTLPTGENDDEGRAKVQTFVLGRVYSGDKKLLEYKTSDGTNRSLLVEA